TTTPAGKAMFQMLGVFAEFERAMIAERVRAGLARARGEGKRLGRPPIAPALEKRIREALATPGRPGVRVIAKQFGVNPGTVQRISRPFEQDEYVVTNFHVIDGCKSEIRVRYPVYQPVNAYIHAIDPSNDLALLSTKLPASGFPSFRLNLKQGEQIASYGFPYGNASFTMGNVTSVVGLDDNTSAFQMSAPVQPGNSGGPLLSINAMVFLMSPGI